MLSLCFFPFPLLVGVCCGENNPIIHISELVVLTAVVIFPSYQHSTHIPYSLGKWILFLKEVILHLFDQLSVFLFVGLV